jgi:peroxiredoxin
MIKKIFTFLILLMLFSDFLFADSFRNSLEKLDFKIIEDNINYFDFSLTDLSGKNISLRDFQGKVIMLNFWATWCPPCREEMPSMEEMNKKMKGKNFIMLAVNVQEKAATVKSFVDKFKYTFPVIIDEKAEAAAKYQIRSIPTTFIIDTKGKIAGAFTGSRDWNTDEVIKVFSELSK